ncbi:MAG: hypothetical protein ACKO96_03430 [Flammeovirgaceae bacterium]
MHDEKAEFTNSSPDKLANPSGTHAKARTNPSAKPKRRHKCRTHPPTSAKSAKANLTIKLNGSPCCLSIKTAANYTLPIQHPVYS